MDTQDAPTAQAEFDDIYISSSEICRELNITRATLTQGRDRGLLPDAVSINEGQITIWKRVTVRPFLNAWKTMLQARRGELTG